MNIRQKKLIANIIIVALFTAVMIVGFANIKNSINRSESIRAMQLIGKEALGYRQKNGSLPNEEYMKQFIEAIGAVRINDIQYRASWIEYGSDPNNTILAYEKKTYTGLVKSGYVVLWLNGKVQWIPKDDFEKILKEQQNQYELQWLKEHFKKQNLP